MRSTQVLDESASAASQSLYYAIAGQPDVELTEQEIAELPYAANYVQFDDQARALIVLGYDDNHSLQWVSANSEVLTTSFAGRVIRTDSLLSNLEHVADSESDSLSCIQFAPSLELAQQCNNAWQRTITTEHNGQLRQWLVDTTFQVEETQANRFVRENGTAVLVSPNADTIEPKTISISNTFEYAEYNDTFRPVESTQWISPELGMLQQQEVKAYGEYLSNDRLMQSNDANSDEKESKDISQEQDVSNDSKNLSNDMFSQDQLFSEPPQLTNQQLWVRLERSNGTKVDIVTDGEPRISQLLDTVPTAQSVMWPQTKISSPALNQQFEARKQGMYVRLKMLAQTYRYDGQTELASKSDALAGDFLTWPLKPSYVTDFSRAKARQDLSQNPLLNHAQVGEHRLNNEPHYTITLSAHYDQTQLPTLPIADHELPKGFRDVNQQLRLFMQYWHFTEVAGQH
ncbi:Group 4 capsule polysaccharide lipoprotein gfcB, YjbF [Pseudidiomarina maritima]|uniref:Group 4 capsule polysaccharide lipoprotein gfcB, YjbF n=1 Tax=Pseudidiomarina maritima TaxID=519453 RepID=A0A1I6GS12_9GAMM|nr:YjbF family lipoprotein [Pseudidiomarina maritima]SFR44968.1 Group 4 capsule polysaccharide lipoprotein gfcB, YjbF [Pseudidiomarina maritima]